MNQCRMCGHRTKTFLDLGRVPLPEEFRLKIHSSKPVVTYPLGLSSCMQCHHVQLSYIVPSDPIYKKNYFYDYSETQTGKAHWEKLADDSFTPGFVVDIGSNTGVLLSYFKKLGARVLGVDPAKKLAVIAQKKGIPTIISYFTPSVARSIVKTHGKADIITCTNVFDHIPDISEITTAFATLLSPFGRLIIEVPYFYQMLTRLSHVVYHQQIDYMMLTHLVPFFNSHNLTLVDAQEIPLHGGSIRLIVRHEGRQTSRLKKLLAREEKMLSQYPKKLASFAKQVIAQRDRLMHVVKTLKKQGKTVAAIGASAKGVTLLNYCHLSYKEIACITEKSPLKIGRFTPSNIPVVSDKRLMDIKPDAAILLAWNFEREIKKNLKNYHGTWILPVP